MRRVRLAILAAVCVAPVDASFAHDGPEHVIATLTAEMAAAGSTAELHYRRAGEYHALRKYAESESDLRAALRLDSDFAPARFELTRLLVRDRRFDEALHLVAPLTPAKDASLRAAALALRGEVRGAQGATSAAVADFTAALALRPDVGWYLARSQLQQRPEDADVRSAGLREGYAATHSPVLRIALCDAELDAAAATEAEFLLQAHLAAASAIIEDELTSVRFRSFWLLRRGRLRRLQGNAVGATRDLHAAIAELTARLDVQRPDPSLFDERAEAYQLLGDTPQAESDVAAAVEVRRRIVAATRPIASVPAQVEP